MRWSMKPIAAVCAVLFATLTATTWGGTTGPLTTGNGGDDPVGVHDVFRQVHLRLPQPQPGRGRILVPLPAPGPPPLSVPEAAVEGP
jgi:hypothetical protein